LANHPEASGDSGASKAYCWYVFFVLLLIYSLNFLDRSVINTLGEQIKLDLAISDTQLGRLITHAQRCSVA
jgi:hypothetical protein